MNWLLLRKELDSLQNLHYKTLQKICSSGGDSSPFLEQIGGVLGLPHADWAGQFVAGDGCRETMIAGIRKMFQEKMKILTIEVFTNPERNVHTESETPLPPKRTKNM